MSDRASAHTADPGFSLEAWLNHQLGECWRGARASAITPLQGDASARRFWRIAIAREASAGAGGRRAPSTAIAIDLGPDDLPLYARTLRLLPEPLPEPPWLNVHRFLSVIGVPVPDLYAADTAARILLVEDVDELTLFDAALTGEAADLYRLAVDELLRLHLNGTKLLDRNCIASQVAYDERLFRWELDQFLEFGVAEVAPAMRREAIAPELDELAARLGRLPRVLSHRDYHGRNLFVQSAADGAPRIRVIDFQDALMAPAPQDLAVLLTTRDASRVITPRVEQRILDYYYAALLRRGAAPMPLAAFNASYQLGVLQHALKVIGRFVYLERTGKSGYLIYLPCAVAQARRMLGQLEDFPALRAGLGG